MSEITTPDDRSVTLRYPITVSGTVVKTLTFRRFRAGDKIRAAEATRGERDDVCRGLKINRFLAVTCNREGLTPELYDVLDGDDQEAVDLTIQGARPTQATDSETPSQDS